MSLALYSRDLPGARGWRVEASRAIAHVVRGIVVLGCAVFGGALRAELEWKPRRLVLNPPAGATEATGIFEFVNRGANPVRIAEVRSGCGCTVMASEKEEVAAGEKGQIRAVFHVGTRKGPQSVDVTVLTNEPEVRQYNLTVDVTIKDFVTVTPSFLFWKVGDDLTPKIFQVTLAPDFRFVGAESTTADFSVEVAGRDGGGVQLRVVPRDSWAKRNGTIKIKVAEKNEAPTEVLAHARVL